MLQMMLQRIYITLHPSLAYCPWQESPCDLSVKTHFNVNFGQHQLERDFGAFSPLQEQG